ncbi:MAG TPA: CsiV family protein [Arenicellales bacterium]|nr:CsiV family protein [Arenicellales bacterium]
MNLSRALSLLSVLALAAQTCFAQSEDAGSQPRIRYHVEVIAFQYQGADTAAGERFDRVLVESYLPEAGFDVDEYNRVRETVSYTSVTQLAGALERLRASPRYSVLAASAWVQPLLSQRQSVAVPFGQDYGSIAAAGSSPGAGANQVAGSVRIFGDHLLFVDMNLLASLAGPASSATGSDSSAGAAGALDVDRNPYGARVYRISERRRIKLEEAHYFDHPHLGALVYVSRYQGG